MYKKLSKQYKITSQIVQTFAKTVGDYNPIHLNSEHAQKTRFGKRIAHGMIGISYLNSILPSYVKCTNLDIKFIKPIFLDETISVQVLISQENNQIKAIIYKVKSDGVQHDLKDMEIATEVIGTWKYQNADSLI